MPTEEILVLDMGAVGLNRDLPPFALKKGEWNVSTNVSMRAGIVSSAAGLSELEKCDPDMTVYGLLPIADTNGYYWAQTGKISDVGACCLYDGSGGRDVTPATGIAVSDGDQFTGGLLNGVPLLNNGLINPPFYLPDAGSTGIWTPLPFTIEAGDPPTVTDTWLTKGISCLVLRPFKNFMFALNISRDAGNYPHLVMWSDAADPGTIPQWQDWNTLDPTILAGEQTIGESGGSLVDAVPLHDLLIIYKEGAVWTADLVGGTAVFRFRRALTTVGAFSPNCVANFRNGHVVLGDGDIILHNGTSAQSIVADRIRKHLFAIIDSDNYKNSFLTVDHDNEEILCCIPEQGEIYPNLAAVWNWRHNTWTVKALPNSTYALVDGINNFGTVQESDAWGSVAGELDIEGNPIDPGDVVPFDPAVWGGDGVSVPYLRVWGERSFNPTLNALVGSRGAFTDNPNGGLFDVDPNVVTWFGENVVQIAERQGIPLLEHDRYGFIRRIYPLVQSTGTIDFYVGSQDHAQAPVTWYGPFTFDPNTMSSFTCRVQGKLFGFRITSDRDVPFQFYGMKILITPTGTQ